MAWNLRKKLLDFGAPFFGFEVLVFLSNFFALNLSFVVLWLKQLFSWHASNGKSGLAYSWTQAVSFTNGQSSSVSLFVSCSSLFFVVIKKWIHVIELIQSFWFDVVSLFKWLLFRPGYLKAVQNSDLIVKMLS